MHSSEVAGFTWAGLSTTAAPAKSRSPHSPRILLCTAGKEDDEEVTTLSDLKIECIADSKRLCYPATTTGVPVSYEYVVWVPTFYS